MNGAIEAGESPVAALLRETSEEAGPDVQIRPVACAHAFLFRYGSRMEAMLSVAYAATYLGGDVVPGSDMEGSAVRWASPSTIEREAINRVPDSKTPLVMERFEVVYCEPWLMGSRMPPNSAQELTASLASLGDVAARRPSRSTAHD